VSHTSNADTPMECPLCKASLRASPIPEEQRHHYGGATHYSDVIGVYDHARDRTTHWRCPECGGTWERR
jgi:hypothetical protein